jgi:hypothetical protein
MDFNETLARLQETTLPTQTLKNPAVSAAVDKKNAELQKKGKQVQVDPKTGKLSVTAYDKVAAGAVNMLNKIK